MKDDPTDEPAFGETLKSRIKVSPEVYAEFLALLDAPAKPNEKLSKLMKARLPWGSN
ncbi:DUF1778 domain-containing protein [Mesorhizobium sp. WSM3224]|uniref:type II toxin-antitoxin system TacA family antitoxin n=1 Tax=Mesorhizobium sp. WSM3224 TaxID=1040986 RepID=UPI0004205345|nr:DUF1778 domain-containing protein [Mesorhizobium sp. WSM3224]